MYRYEEETAPFKVLAHDLDADHGHSGSGVFLVDDAKRRRFIGVLSGSLRGRDPVSLATPFTNSVAHAGSLTKAVEGAIAEVESE